MFSFFRKKPEESKKIIDVMKTMLLDEKVMREQVGVSNIFDYREEKIGEKILDFFGSKVANSCVSGLLPVSVSREVLNEFRSHMASAAIFNDPLGVAFSCFSQQGGSFSQFLPIPFKNMDENSQTMLIYILDNISDGQMSKAGTIYFENNSDDLHEAKKKKSEEKFTDICNAFYKLSKEPLETINQHITTINLKSLLETIYHDIPEFVLRDYSDNIAAMIAMMIVAKNGVNHGEINSACMLSVATIWASMKLKEKEELSDKEKDYASELEIEARAIIMDNHKSVTVLPAKLLIAATMTAKQ